MSTKSIKGIWLLLVEPLDLERVINKSKRAVDTLQAAIGSVEIQASINTIHPASIDTIHPTLIGTIHLESIDTVHPGTVHFDIVHPSTVHLDTVHRPSIGTVHPPLIDTVHPPSIDTVHHDIVHRNTVHRDTVHRDTVHRGTIHHGTVHPMTDTTCVETEMVEVLILKVDENEMLRDEEGLPHEDPRNLIKELEELALASEQNEVYVDHIISKIFPYSLFGDAFSWTLKAFFSTNFSMKMQQLDRGSSMICWTR
ncbi:hypothetical protein YC2023_010569 [Brassica napus]